MRNVKRFTQMVEVTHLELQTLLLEVRNEKSWRCATN